MSKIIVVANQKGGVAKTSTVRNLSYSLAELGKKVLTVDLDPQSNLTIGFGKVGAEYSLSGRSIANYVRVDSLITALKIRLDNGELTLAVSVELSYPSTEVQQYIENVLMENEFKVDVKKATVLRSYGDKLTEDIGFIQPLHKFFFGHHLFPPDV